MDINLTNLPSLTSVLPGNTSDSRNSSLLIHVCKYSYIMGPIVQLVASTSADQGALV